MKTIDILQINPERIQFSLNRELLYSDGDTKITYWIDDECLCSKIRHKWLVYAIKNKITYQTTERAKSVATRIESGLFSTVVTEWSHIPVQQRTNWLSDEDMLILLKEQVEKLVNRVNTELIETHN